MKPNLSNYSNLTCDALMRITGQGAVYVRTLEQLTSDEKSDENSDEEVVGDSTLPSLQAQATNLTPRCLPRQRLDAEIPVQSDMEGMLVTTLILSSSIN